MTPPVISLSSSADFTYTVGDTWNYTNALNWCSALDNVDSSVSCTLDDSSLYNILDGTTFNAAGTKTITYRAEDEAGNVATKNQTVTITSGGDGGTPNPGIPVGYYNSITPGLTGSALRQALTQRITNHTIISYSNVQYTLDEADADPNAVGKILTVYDRSSVSSTWDSGSTWNKEHIWPQSSYDEASPMVSDIHHLRAAKPNINSTRGNNYFNIISGNTGNWQYFDSRFYPGNVDKGDVARMLLYMAVRYYDQNLRLVKSDFGTTTRNARTLGDIDILLTWHQEDPVDDFEINRNNVIYGVQNNRNPFIDRPDLFEPVWTYLVSVAETLQMSIQLYEKAIEDYATLMVTYAPASSSTKSMLI